MSHTLISRYRHSAEYQTSAQVEQGIRRNPSGPDSDVAVANISFIRNRSLPLSGTLSWNHTRSKDRLRDLSTDALTLQTRWQAAPGLQHRQTLSYGNTRAAFLHTESRSIMMVQQLDGTPTNRLTANIYWSERWTSVNLGIGYDRFTETRLDVSWRVAPLVTLASRTRYQRRFESVWDSRQTATWTPMRGGAVETSFSGDIYYDSRVEVWQQGVRFDLIWKIRPGLRADGSVQYSRYLFENRVARPLTTHFFVGWNF